VRTGPSFPPHPDACLELAIGPVLTPVRPIYQQEAKSSHAVRDEDPDLQSTALRCQSFVVANLRRLPSRRGGSGQDDGANTRATMDMEEVVLRILPASPCVGCAISLLAIKEKRSVHPPATTRAPKGS
jgi:hypothetical protein